MVAGGVPLTEFRESRQTRALRFHPSPASRENGTGRSHCTQYFVALRTRCRSAYKGVRLSPTRLARLVLDAGRTPCTGETDETFENVTRRLTLPFGLRGDNLHFHAVGIFEEYGAVPGAACVGVFVFVEDRRAARAELLR